MQRNCDCEGDNSMMMMKIITSCDNIISGNLIISICLFYKIVYKNNEAHHLLLRRHLNFQMDKNDAGHNSDLSNPSPFIASFDIREHAQRARGGWSSRKERPKMPLRSQLPNDLQSPIVNSRNIPPTKLKHWVIQ